MFGGNSGCSSTPLSLRNAVNLAVMLKPICLASTHELLLGTPSFIIVSYDINLPTILDGPDKGGGGNIILREYF